MPTPLSYYYYLHYLIAHLFYLFYFRPICILRKKSIILTTTYTQLAKWGQAPLALVFLSLVSMLSITFPISTALGHIIAKLPR